MPARRDPDGNHLFVPCPRCSTRDPGAVLIFLMAIRQLFEPTPRRSSTEDSSSASSRSKTMKFSRWRLTKRWGNDVWQNFCCDVAEPNCVRQYALPVVCFYCYFSSPPAAPCGNGVDMRALMVLVPSPARFKTIRKSDMGHNDEIYWKVVLFLSHSLVFFRHVRTALIYLSAFIISFIYIPNAFLSSQKPS